MITRRKLLAAFAAGVAAIPFLGRNQVQAAAWMKQKPLEKKPVDFIVYQGKRMRYSGELTLRKDERLYLYSCIEPGRPVILNKDDFTPCIPLEDVNVKYNVGINQDSGEIVPMPCLIVCGQRVRTVCYEAQYDGRLRHGEQPTPLYRTITT